MTYIIVSNSARGVKEGCVPRSSALIIPTEKKAIITDIVLAVLLTTAAILATLANNGVNLGQLSGIGALGINSVYIFAAGSGGILIIDFTNFIIRLAKHLAYLQRVNKNKDQKITDLQRINKNQEQEITGLQQNLDGQIKQLKDKENIHQKSTQEIANLKATQENLETRIQKLDVKQEKLKAKIQVKETLEKLQKQLEETKRQIQQIIEQKEAQSTQLDSQIAEKGGMLTDLETQLQTVQDSIAAHKKIYETLQTKDKFKNKLIPLSALIQGDTAGDLAGKLSIHWLKNAATRIFPNPLRSFLELVVNGLDASVPPSNSVGKFGMGFISILGLFDHAETDGCTIGVETTAKNEEGIFTSLRMELFKNQANYQFILKNQPSQDETGTCITLKPKKGKFSKETLDTLMLYCWALQFYEHGKIEVSYEGNIYSIGEGSRTVVWVTLDHTRLIVEDKGCGMTEEVICKKLFVPSSSTKNAEKENTTDVHLPEFKTYRGKKNTHPHFLISINGPVVIDIPFNNSANSQDLLLKMPASTRLTLARDAIENRPETIHYLKKVIDATVQASVSSKENAILLDALCKGLKTWEAMTPSIAETHLSAYLHQSVLKFLQESAHIPYPLEQADALKPLLPNNEKLIPFPKDLLFAHFGAFENLLEEHYRAEKMDTLIAGKSVLFTDMDKVTSLGLKNWIFAPKSLIESNPTEKSLQMSLVTRYADDGKQLEVPGKKQVSLMPRSMEQMNSPRNFLFITGRETIPFVYTWEKTSDRRNYDVFAHPSKISLDKEDTPDLAQRNNEQISPHIKLSLLHKVFADADEKPFEEMWNKEREALSQYFFDTVNSICRKKYNFYFDFQDASYSKRQERRERTETTFGYEETPSKEIKFFVLKNFDDVEKVVEEKKKTSRKNEYDFLKDSVDPYLEPISSAQACKLMFAWLFSQMGALNTGVKIFTDEQAFWPPPKTITLEYLQSCFEVLVKNRKEAKRVIASSYLTSFEEQEGIWKTLEDFMAYQPYGPHAIKQIFPLLLLKEEIFKSDFPAPLHRKFDSFVQQLLSTYSSFLEIKIGDVDNTYGSELSVARVVDTSPFDHCSIDEIVQLLNSLKEKPQLFEKCLDLYVQELTQRMDRKKRDKTLKENRPLYVDTICCNNGLALLSMAKSIGIDQMLIETVVQHVKDPFELYMLGLVLLGPYKKNYFIEPADPTTALILTEAIIIYLRKSKPLRFIKKYTEKYGSRWFEKPSDTFKKFNQLLIPIMNFFYEVTKGKKKREAFKSKDLAIPNSIHQKMEGATSFTSIQLIHAAQHEETFTAVLQKGNLSDAVAIVQKHPQESDLQMISQAVEHGSERSGTHSTLIEAFQNSVDAIRNFLKQHPDAPAEKAVIAFDVCMVGTDTPNLLIEVADPIGMQSLKTLLANFLIPNYSEKGGDCVGEMGNGSYQMYREAKLVTVKTRTLEEPSRVYFLKIEPIRHSITQEVIDLRHTCIEITDLEPSFVGTTLNVVMQSSHETKSAVTFEGILARNFIKETFAVAIPSLGDKHNLKCILKFPDGEQTLDGIKRKNPFKIDGSNLCCYQIYQHDQPGYVLTDGYPFKPLEIFLVEEELLPPELAQEVGSGWCLNLPKGSYTPVQSRMRVHMTKETKKELKAFLLDWIYYRSCCSESSGPKRRYYPHFDSSCPEFYQVTPFARKNNVPDSVFTKGDFTSLEAFFVNYTPSFLQKNFKKYIKESYENYVHLLIEKRITCKSQIRSQLTSTNHEVIYAELTRTFKKECGELEVQWLQGLKASNKYEKMFFDQVLISWFKPKTDAFSYSIPSLESFMRENKKMQTAEEVKQSEVRLNSITMSQEQKTELLQCSKDILSHYCTFYARINEIERSPGIDFTYEDNPQLAYYQAKGHKIFINLAHVQLSSIFEMGKQVAAENPLKNNLLVSISYMSSGLLNHELEHARRSDDCNGAGAHDRMEIEGKNLDFEACAAYFAKKAQMNGLFDHWAKELKKLNFPTDDLLSKLIEMEKTCPEMLLEMHKE